MNKKSKKILKLKYQKLQYTIGWDSVLQNPFTDLIFFENLQLVNLSIKSGKQFVNTLFTNRTTKQVYTTWFNYTYFTSLYFNSTIKNFNVVYSNTLKKSTSLDISILFRNYKTLIEINPFKTLNLSNLYSGKYNYKITSNDCQYLLISTYQNIFYNFFKRYFIIINTILQQKQI